MDFKDILYGPLMQTLGTDATLTVDGADYAIRAEDATAGVEVMDLNIGMQTVKPVAYVKQADLDTHGLTRANLYLANINLNGEDWQIHSTMAQPSPFGASDGLVMLLLSE